MWRFPTRDCSAAKDRPFFARMPGLAAVALRATTFLLAALAIGLAPRAARADFTMSYVGKNFVVPTYCKPSPIKICPTGPISVQLNFTGDFPANYTGKWFWAPSYAATNRFDSLPPAPSVRFSSGTISVAGYPAVPITYMLLRFTNGVVSGTWDQQGTQRPGGCSSISYGATSFGDSMNSFTCNPDGSTTYYVGRNKTPGTWTINKVTEASQNRILGLWRGTYVCSGVTTGIDVSFFKTGPDVWTLPTSNSPVLAQLTYYPAGGGLGATKVISASVIGVNSTRLILSLQEKAPMSLSMLDGNVNASVGTISGNATGAGCTSFKLSRLAPDAAPLPTCTNLNNKIAFMQNQIDLLRREAAQLNKSVTDKGDTATCTVLVVGNLLTAMAVESAISTYTKAFSTGVIKLTKSVSKDDNEFISQNVGDAAAFFFAPDQMTAGLSKIKECKIAKYFDVSNHIREIYGQAQAWRVAIDEAKGKIARLCQGGSV
jgi:hypothetical protein